MRELQDKQRKKYLIYSFPSLILLSILTVLIIKGTLSIAFKEHSSANKIEELKTESDNLNQEKKDLDNKISRIQTDDGIKEEIRRKFSVAEEGEQVAVIVSAQAVSSSTSKSHTRWVSDLWQRLTNLWSKSHSGYNPDK